MNRIAASVPLTRWEQKPSAPKACGEPLLRELDGLWKFRVRRFQIVYAINRKTHIIRLMAVGHRQFVYEELTARLRRKDKE